MKIIILLVEEKAFNVIAVQELMSNKVFVKILANQEMIVIILLPHV
jgi:hypothetical protein